MAKKEPKAEVDVQELKKAIFTRFALVPIGFFIMFFLPAGSFRYWQAWLYIAVILLPMAYVVAYFLKHDPALLERRMRMKEKQKEQRAVIKLGYLIFGIGFLIPGLDFRFGWSSVPFELVIVSSALVFLGYLACFFVMKENSYLSRTVVVEKGQKVISTGPYAVVRHPMYTGVLLMYSFTPTALGSYWALIPFLPFLPLIIYRLLNEEKLLLKDLKGYREYCKKTPYRLIPRVW